MTTDDEPGARLAVVADHMDFVSETPTSIAADIRALTAERDAALRLAEERAGVIAAARVQVSGCIGRWQSMVDEVWRCDPESYVLGGQLDVDLQLRRVEIALIAAGGSPDSGAKGADDGDQG